MPPPTDADAPSPARCRLYIVLAAVLWSLSGALTTVLRQETPLGLNTPPIGPLQIAFLRVFFAGLALLPTLRRRDLTFRPAMAAMVVSFGVMNALFVGALASGKAANAILLQYTAPLWLLLAGWLGLGDPVDRRGLGPLLVALAGVAVIVAGGWDGGERAVVAMALGSGFAYAGVLLGLRRLRGESPRWLTVINHLGAALVLVPVVWLTGLPAPGQLAFLLAFGAVQMALPYWLMALGLRRVSPQEAGMLTLLEPLLNPLWAYLVSPATQTPLWYTWVGGAFILAALAWRYSFPAPRPPDGPK